MKLEEIVDDKRANRTVICPYSEDNRNHHVVPVCDMLLHLAKCRRLYYKRCGVKMELKRCKYNGCHYIPGPEVMLHELTCHSRRMYEECKQKMQYPPIPVETIRSSANSNIEKQELNGDIDLMVFD
uniref:TAZ-type domain-containing protein n=1 Tax=Setaria digitata TaxID=48799 RepID=A0A915PNY5_9BILA